MSRFHCSEHDRGYSSECPQCVAEESRDAIVRLAEAGSEDREASDPVDLSGVEEKLDLLAELTARQLEPGDHHCPECGKKSLITGMNKCQSCGSAVPDGFWEELRRKKAEKDAADELSRKREAERIKIQKDADARKAAEQAARARRAQEEENRRNKVVIGFLIVVGVLLTVVGSLVAFGFLLARDYYGSAALNDAAVTTEVKVTGVPTVTSATSFVADPISVKGHHGGYDELRCAYEIGGMAKVPLEASVDSVGFSQGKILIGISLMSDPSQTEDTFVHQFDAGSSEHSSVIVDDRGVEYRIVRDHGEYPINVTGGVWSPMPCVFNCDPYPRAMLVKPGRKYQTVLEFPAVPKGLKPEFYLQLPHFKRITVKVE